MVGLFLDSERILTFLILWLTVILVDRRIVQSELLLEFKVLWPIRCRCSRCLSWTCCRWPGMICLTCLTSVIVLFTGLNLSGHLGKGLKSCPVTLDHRKVDR